MLRSLFALSRVLLFFVMVLTVCLSASAQELTNPAAFLGYGVGQRFTPHHKLVSYFEKVAQQAPDRVKLIPYGTTNEGRPLLVAAVSTPANLERLESIRMNNLRLANVARDRAAAIEAGAPAIVWLSYNVHGNEASSSEASLLTLYTLVLQRDIAVQRWLSNTVVLIDPCLNPDGRDRYVNWYNNMLGAAYNPLANAREHREPWPGGRTNHYYFDLNRDWAWQVQTETRQRMKLYHEWMPQVHVDFHEQGYNEPYYFAPAAEPYHEVVTPWQRNFQELIGKNHARYFDSNGWLYFTKQVFDLLYPSYGDTYPTYNGSIGMTYEQGGIGAGLGVINKDGDTLTLVDRALHHFTTTLSTLETAANQSGRLIAEFRKYFNQAVSTGQGIYKSYVIRSQAGDESRLRSLLELLDRNGIRYEQAMTGTAKGFRYSSGKEEAFTMQSSDLIISALQPRAALLTTLFEPRTRLSDSVTYDITAWSLPYAYGLEAYACKDKIAAQPYAAPSGKPTFVRSTYGYAIPWNGLEAVRLATAIGKSGILLRYAEQAFTVGGKNFAAGTVLVLPTSNQKLGVRFHELVQEAASMSNAALFPIATGLVESGSDFGSEKVRNFSLPRVALLTGEGIGSNAVGEIWHHFDQQLNYPISLINQSDLNRMSWTQLDVLILADGNYSFLSNKDQAEACKKWIQGGGRLIALESAVTQLSDWGIKLRKGDEPKSTDSVQTSNYEMRERESVSGITPGSIWPVQLDNTHPLAFGYPKTYYTLKMDGNVLASFKEGGWNVGVLKTNTPINGYAGKEYRSNLSEGTLFGVQPMGRGQIVCLVDNPLFRSFWENGKLLLSNAVFLVGQ
ncbi:MAG: zinc carboxypeptidase [Bacteroidetes bacterium]|nr:zinc carboxypeptidase [Bacteroidota bacterium]